MLSALEVYNKPSFAYREETFAILATNSWELLLKARILQVAENKVSSILKYARRTRSDGGKTDKYYRVKNRSGTHLSIGLFEALDRLENQHGERVDPSVRENIELVCEVRDNAIHFVNKGDDLPLIVQQLGTASVRNYVLAIRRWFGLDLSEFNFFLMPLAFFGSNSDTRTVPINSSEKRLTEYLRSRTLSDRGENPDEFNVALNVELRFTRTKEPEAHPVHITNDPTATPVALTEENIREKYPWDYDILTARLRKKFPNFKSNAEYHSIRKQLEKDSRYCKTRHLDPASPKGITKRFYNPNIIKEFERHYKK